MAVYTHLSDDDMRKHLRQFRVGTLQQSRGVSAGTINTIYDITTDKGRYILRILEDRAPTDARFEEALLLLLHERELLVPRMLPARSGHIVSISPRQHLSVFEYLPGRELGVFEITAEHTQQVGAFLATMHLAARGLRRRRRNRFSPERMERVAQQCAKAAAKRPEDLEAAHVEALRETMSEHGVFEELPTGVIHGDMFIDNARFVGGNLCGVLDFEMASNGPLAYDLAVALCDWGFSNDTLDLERAAGMVSGYVAQRRLSGREREALYRLCLFATARFALTRFYEFEVRTRPGAQRLYKDYRHFMTRLQSLRGLGPDAFRRQVLERGETAGSINAEAK